ncbi:MAG: dTMP kinase [Ruminococcus sp.]
MAEGKIIVLDGLDGCGKSTQFEALQQLLREHGKAVKPISFPMYDKPSAALVKMYLHGDFSDTPGGVNAYAASSFYAVDRYANYKLDWEKNYSAGEWILASRYTTSNAIHQMSKLPAEQWDDYLAWLEDYEYNKLGLPKPDLVLFLSMPLELSQQLLSRRYEGDAAKKDIHEADLQYLEQCDRAARYAGERLGWHRIECANGTSLRSITEIRDELFQQIQEELQC